jgi:hypothetical protein
LQVLGFEHERIITLRDTQSVEVRQKGLCDMCTRSRDSA